MSTAICLEAYRGENHFHWTTSESEAEDDEVMTEHDAQLMEEYAYLMRDEHNNSILTAFSAHYNLFCCRISENIL